jgi:hypothetical protein
MLHSKQRSLLAGLFLLTLAGCATQYGTAVGAFGQIQVASPSVLDVRIIRYIDLVKVYPRLPGAVPADDAGLAGLLQDAPSGRPNQGEYLYRAGRYFLSYRCGATQRFVPISVRSTDALSTFKVSCS